MLKSTKQNSLSWPGGCYSMQPIQSGLGILVEFSAEPVNPKLAD